MSFVFFNYYYFMIVDIAIDIIAKKNLFETREWTIIKKTKTERNNIRDRLLVSVKRIRWKSTGWNQRSTTIVYLSSDMFLVSVETGTREEENDEMKVDFGVSRTFRREITTW